MIVDRRTGFNALNLDSSLQIQRFPDHRVLVLGLRRSTRNNVMERYDNDGSGALSYDEVQQFLMEIRAMQQHVMDAVLPLYNEEEGVVEIPIGDVLSVVEETEDQVGVEKGMLTG